MMMMPVLLQMVMVTIFLFLQMVVMMRLRLRQMVLIVMLQMVKRMLLVVIVLLTVVMAGDLPVDLSLVLRHALRLREFQELRRRLLEAAGEGGDHALLQARV